MDLFNECGRKYIKSLYIKDPSFIFIKETVEMNTKEVEIVHELEHRPENKLPYKIERHH
jgi:hypothetical protein